MLYSTVRVQFGRQTATIGDTESATLAIFIVKEWVKRSSNGYEMKLRRYVCSMATRHREVRHTVKYGSAPNTILYTTPL